MKSKTPNTIGHRLVRASAGTGKTYALTVHYLRLIHAGVGADQILATTFTRAAAGEILDRVLSRLASAAADADKARKLGEDIQVPGFGKKQAGVMLAALCRSLHRIAISTIDSFFVRVAGSFRLELGLPPSPDMRGEDDPDVNRVRMRAIEAMLADEEPQTLVELLRRFHHDSAVRSVTSSIESIVTTFYNVYRQAPDEAVWNPVDISRPPSREQLAEVEERLATLISSAAMKNKKMAAAIGTVYESVLARDWEEVAGKTIIASVREGKHKYGTSPIPDNAVTVLLRVVKAADSMVKYSVAQRGRAAFELVRRFSTHFDALREREGIVLFSDLPLRLSMDLPDTQDIYYRIDASVRHLMLDEFQDTSLTQWSVIQPMALEVTSTAPSVERSFFCVGDRKQAIYAWRGGCPELFDIIEHDLPLGAGALESLSRSYRSSQVVLDAVNRVFAELSDNPAFETKPEFAAIARDWAAGYERHVADKKKPGYVELVSSRLDGRSEDEEPDASEDGSGDDRDNGGGASQLSGHEQFVAELVRSLVDRSPGRSVGVLTATNKMARRLLHALRELKIDASGEGGQLLTDDPAVNVVLAALTLADHPGDEVAWFHVVNSPLGAVVGATREAQPAAVSRRIRSGLIEDGYAGLIARWAQALAPSCNARSVHRLTQLIEVGDAYDAGRSLRPSRFVDHARATQVEEPSAASVRVMTIHRSKGLEFDAVVLPELERLLGQVSGAVMLHRPSPGDPIDAVFPSMNENIRPLIPGAEKAFACTRRARVLDDLSALYVGMTRARHALHMIVKPLKPKKNGEASVVGWKNLSPAALLRQVLGEGTPDFDPETRLFSAGNEDWADRLEKPAAAGLQPDPAPLQIKLAPSPHATRTLPIVSPSALQGGGRVPVSRLLSLTTSEALERGSVLHAWFEQIGFLDRGEFPGETQCMEIAASVAPGVGRAVAAAWFREFTAMLEKAELRSALCAPAARPATDPSRVEVELWRERPFIVTMEGRLLRGQFDRVVVERQGGKAIRAEVLDYKSDRIEGEMVESLVETYRPQVTAYCRALTQMLGLGEADVVAKLLFLMPGRVVRV